MLSCYCYMLWFIRVDDGDGTFQWNFDLHSDATEEAICQQQIQEHKEELVNNLPSPSWHSFTALILFSFFFPSSLLLVFTHSLLATGFCDCQMSGNKENGLGSSSGVISSGPHHTTFCVCWFCALYISFYKAGPAVYTVYINLSSSHPLEKLTYHWKTHKKTQTKMGFKWMLT